MLTTKALILAKVETTYGDDALPTAALNAILCADPEYGVLDAKVERNNIKPNFGAKRFVAIGEGQTLSFTCELKGNGTTGAGITAPEIGTLLRGCNFTQAIVTTTGQEKVTYTPNSNQSGESLTLYYYLDGLVHKLCGCRGSVSIDDAKVNQYVKVKFDFTGIYQGVAADTLPSPTFNATVPPIFRGASFAIDSYAAIVDGIAIEIKNDVVKRVDVNEATGIKEYLIKERIVTGKIAAEMVTPATKDFWGMWSGGSAYAMTCTVGSTAGNRCIITAPAAQIDKPTYGDRENILTADLPLVLCPTSAGNDELIFTFN